MSCFESDCERALDRRAIIKHTSSANRTRLNKLLAELFVRGNPTIRWCPAANCTYAIRFQHPIQADSGPYPVKCAPACRKFSEASFCFACGKDSHSPAPCAMLGACVHQTTQSSFPPPMHTHTHTHTYARAHTHTHKHIHCTHNPNKRV